jgi:hypothetical protein
MCLDAQRINEGLSELVALITGSWISRIDVSRSIRRTYHNLGLITLEGITPPPRLIQASSVQEGPRNRLRVLRPNRTSFAPPLTFTNLDTETGFGAVPVAADREVDVWRPQKRESSSDAAGFDLGSPFHHHHRVQECFDRSLLTMRTRVLPAG